MSIRRSTIQKSTASMLLVWMWFNLLLSPTAALAQELEGDPTPTPEVVQVQEQVQEPTPDPTPEPTPEAVSETTTGDATAVGDVQTDVNDNTTTLPGEITTGDCGSVEGELDCPDDVIIATENEATTSADLNSEADTGDNLITGELNESTTESGDATALGLMSTQTNTNVVELEPIATPIPSGTIAPENENPSLTVINDNQAQIDNNAEVSAQTGENTSEGAVDVSNIVTGDATGLANLVNIVNTNIVGSGFQVVSIDITGEDEVDLDLNELWKMLLSIDENGDVSQLDWPSSPNLTIRIINSNQASVTNDVNVTADTGNNTINGEGEALIDTGDAVAAANVSNVVNTNILGSNFLLLNLNIMPGSKVNLILPRPELFGLGSEGGVNGQGVDWITYNLAVVSNNINAVATTGDNESEGGTTITGDAVAVANSTTIANTNISMNDWFFLALNNLGGWDGQIWNWTTAGAVDYAGAGSNVLQIGGGSESENDVLGGQGLVAAWNEADITNNVNVTANTGGNIISGNGADTSINTGNAAAIANVLNLVNMNILGSNWFMGMVNVLGAWGGKVIFAYPDVTVSLSADREIIEPGDVITYNLHYENVGYDVARGVKVNLDLPKGMSFVSSSGKISGGCSQTYCSWDVGSLTPKQSGDVTVQMRVDDGFDFGQSLSWLDSLIPSAKAADDRKDKEINARATIATSDPESDTSNNSFSVSGIVYEKLPQGGVDERQPDLSLTAWNNVNEFVYPGDTVTFVLTVKNSADIIAKNVKIIHKLYNSEGEFIGSSLFETGDLEPGKGGKVSFGLNVPRSAPGGVYKTESYAIAEAVNGNTVTSNTSVTNFRVSGGVTGSGSEIALPAQPVEGEVLGAATEAGPLCTDRRQDLWVFVMLFLTSTVLLANRLENRINLANVLKSKIRG